MCSMMQAKRHEPEGMHTLYNLVIKLFTACLECIAASGTPVPMCSVMQANRHLPEGM